METIELLRDWLIYHNNHPTTNRWGQEHEKDALKKLEQILGVQVLKIMKILLLLMMMVLMLLMMTLLEEIYQFTKFPKVKCSGVELNLDLGS